MQLLSRSLFILLLISRLVALLFLWREVAPVDMKAAEVRDGISQKARSRVDPPSRVGPSATNAFEHMLLFNSVRFI